MTGMEATLFLLRTNYFPVKVNKIFSEPIVFQFRKVWSRPCYRTEQVGKWYEGGWCHPPYVPLPTLGGWHPDSHRAMMSIAVNIASRTLNSLEYARQTLFQRHAALLVANNAVCLISGFDLRI